MTMFPTPVNPLSLNLYAASAPSQNWLLGDPTRVTYNLEHAALPCDPGFTESLLSSTLSRMT
jgi:hypothetical protein